MADYRHDFPPFMVAFFEEMVNRPYREAPATEAWEREVRSVSYVPHHTNTILQRGRAEFDRGANGLSPDEMLLLYCNYMMQMHAVTSYHVLVSAPTIFGDNFARSNDVVTVDFGCGPLTWGVAMAWYYLGGQEPPVDRLCLRYIGLDQSTASLRRAMVMAQSPLLFAPTPPSMGLFANRPGDAKIVQTIGEYIEGIANPLIVLNFAFLFASPTLNIPRLVTTIRAILEAHGQHTICVIFQNPPNVELNIRWNVFKQSMPELHLILGNNAEDWERVFYVDTTGRRFFTPNRSHLYFQILSNRTQPVLLGAPAA
jgi:hypothetical protein